MKKLMLSIAVAVACGASFVAGEKHGFSVWFKKYGAPLGVTVEQARRNMGGGQFFYKPITLGPHKYIICDFPDARGNRNSAFIHDPTCSCGRNVR